MHQQKNKKIFIYIFLFFIIGTFNNKNLTDKYLFRIENIYVTGLDEKSNNKSFDGNKDVNDDSYQLFLVVKKLLEMADEKDIDFISILNSSIQRSKIL